MFGLSALELARVQFGFTIAVHIIFPAITVGLASYLAVLEGLWLWRKDVVYRDLYSFWSKIFAVNFGMGVVSGLVMAYQFGTNWSYFSNFAGSVTGPLLTYEVLTAFFLEAGFLGVMLFGFKKVGPGLHFFATIMVALGTLISTTWILASNSWLQTPQGFDIVNGRVVPTHWLQVIFNPSFPYRLAHMTVAAFLATALFVAASGAWHVLRGRATRATKKMLSMAMWLILIVTPIQMAIGDAHGLNTLRYQPAKIAAIEGHWDNRPGQSVPLIVFGLPDMHAERTRGAIEVPYLGSLILTHDVHGRIPSLKQFPAADRPNSTIVFWTFRVMVGLGVLMLLLGFWSVLLRWRGSLFESRAFLRIATLMGPSGLIAIIAGWLTTEIGRQPWVVYGVMRTKDAVSNQTEGGLQSRMKGIARRVAMALLLVIVGVSLWTPLSHPEIWTRWFAFPEIVLFSPVPILILPVTWILLRMLERDSHAWPFVSALFLVFMGYTGLVISLWPHIVPPEISFRDAAAPPQSMGFTLVGVLFVIPFILAYTAWSHYVFRGKVKVGAAYH